MQIAAVGDIHGDEHLDAFAQSLRGTPDVDLFLLAGDTTDRNDLDAFDRVLGTLRDAVSAPIWGVFGNNEYEESQPSYRRIARGHRVRFLQDEAALFQAAGGQARIVGSTGSLDRPTWWQRRNLPHLESLYRRRIEILDGLLADGEPRILLTHYPPTYATMGGEKEAWRPELGCRALEPVLLRRRPDLVVHGHIHKGIPFAELRAPRTTLDAFADGARPVPVHNVAFPVRGHVMTFEL